MRKGSKLTEEQKIKVREATKKAMANPEIREKMIQIQKNIWANPELRKKQSEIVKKSWSNPELRKKQSEAHRGNIPSEETKLKMSLAHKGKSTWNKGIHFSEEVKNQLYATRKGKITWMKGKHHSEKAIKKLSEANKGKIPWMAGKKHSEETKMKISEVVKKAMSNPEIKRRLSEIRKGKITSEETKKKLSLASLGRYPSEESKKKMSNTWNKPEYQELAKERRATQIFPLKDSKPEIKIQNFLGQLGITFLKHRYMREIEHKYQCDIFIPSKNLVIEIDGNYWHKYPYGNEIDHIRTKELLEKGFKVLRLWESDIKKMTLEEFKKRIEEVLRKERQI